MRQIIRYNMPLLGAAFWLILVASQTLASVATLSGNNPASSTGNEKHSLPSASSVISSSISQQQNKHQQILENVAAIAHQMTSAAFNVERQGRSSTNNNNIDGSKWYRSETDKKQVMEFLLPKNLFKNIINLIWGNPDEHSRTSRHVLDILVKALELIKTSFIQKARSAAGRGLKDAMDDAASAGVAMFQGYVKSIRAGTEECSERYLCEASREAVRDGRQIGGFIAQVGGYASSYLLEKSVTNKINQATQRGRNNEDCAKLYQCQENQL